MTVPPVGPGRGVRAWIGGIVLGVSLLASCGGGIRDVWTGSGEFKEARFYAMDLNLAEKKPFAMLKWRNGGELLLAVCALNEEDGRVSFKMDVDAQAASCDRMVQPLRFTGEFGRDVLAGTVEDSSGTQRGVFRVFRVQR